MRRLLVAAIPLFLIGLLTACGQQQPEKDIKTLTYEWEKARFENNYDREQELLYEKGAYEVDKNDRKTDSELKEDDIRYEIYYDKELEHYYVFADFKNPKHNRFVRDLLMIRKKEDEWKVDTRGVRKITRDQVKREFEKKACMNCK